ncbi:MAG: RHS repeat-associated core domain-containing protein [Pseudomonadota bacterium]
MKLQSRYDIPCRLFLLLMSAMTTVAADPTHYVPRIWDATSAQFSASPRGASFTSKNQALQWLISEWAYLRETYAGTPRFFDPGCVPTNELRGWPTKCADTGGGIDGLEGCTRLWLARYTNNGQDACWFDASSVDTVPKCDDGTTPTFYKPGYREALCVLPQGIGCAANEIAHGTVCEPSPNLSSADAGSGCGVGNPCNPSTGNKYQPETDLRGVVRLERHYNSVHPSTIDPTLPPGWTHTYSARIVRTVPVVRYGEPPMVGAFRADGRLERFSASGAGQAIWLSESTSALRLTVRSNRWIVHHGDGSQEHYQSGDGANALDGRLLALINQAGQTTALIYDDDGDLATLDRVVGPFGHTLTFRYDINNRLTSVLDPAGKAIIYGFDNNAGQLIRVTYPTNETRIYHYEDPGYPNHLTGITDERGTRYATYQYDASGRAVMTEHANTNPGVNPTGQGRWTFTYEVDGNGDPKTIATDARGASTTYTFPVRDGQRWPTSIIHRDGTVTSVGSVDAQNRPDRHTDERQFTTSYTYADGVHRTTMTEAVGTTYARASTTTYLADEYDLPTVESHAGVTGALTRVTSTVYEPDSRLPRSVTRSGFRPDGTPVSRTIALAYNADGQVVTIDGPRLPTDVNDITTLDYWDTDNLGRACPAGNRCGQLKSSQNAAGHVTHYDGYNHYGQLTQMTGPNGLITQYEYDDRQRLLSISEIPPAPNNIVLITRNTYTPNGQIETVATPDGATLTYRYNAAQELIRVEDSLGHYVTYHYDLNGNRTSENTYDPYDMLRQHVSMAHDARDRVLSVNRAGSITAFDYDDEGNPTVTTDPNYRETHAEYDALDRIVKTIDALSGETTFGYDVSDRKTTVTDAAGRRTTYVYDDLGNLISLNNPDTGLTQYTYDEAGNRLTETDARGVTTAYTYDALSRLLTITTPNGLHDVSFTYDSDALGVNGLGRLTHMSDEAGDTDYAYDARGNVIRETKTIDGQSYQVRYTWDERRRLTSITYPSGRVVGFTRDSLGRVASVTLDDSGATTILAKQFQYRPFGPATRWTLGNGITTSMDFDSQYRVTNIQAAMAIDHTMSYDPVGNVLTLANGVDNARDQVFTYDGLDRLDTASGGYGTRDFDYDEIGNRQDARHTGSSMGIVPHLKSTTRIHGEHNRLSSVYQDGNLIASYTYNGRGERVIKTVDGQTTHFHYGLNGELLAESDDTGAPVREYIYLHGAPLALIDHISSDVYYYHNDHLGTPQSVTDASQTVVWEAHYTPFGTIEETVSDITHPLRFPGQYFDAETKTHYNYFRDYDPSVGRYTQSDPIGLEGGVNTYLYVQANPMRFVDPFGEQVVTPMPGGPFAPPGYSPLGNFGPERAPATLSQLQRELGDLSDRLFTVPDVRFPPPSMEDRNLICTTRTADPLPPLPPNPGGGCQKLVENMISRCATIQNRGVRRSCLVAAFPLYVFCQTFKQ